MASNAPQSFEERALEAAQAILGADHTVFAEVKSDGHLYVGVELVDPQWGEIRQLTLASTSGRREPPSFPPNDSDGRLRAEEIAAAGLTNEAAELQRMLASLGFAVERPPRPDTSALPRNPRREALIDKVYAMGFREPDWRHADPQPLVSLEDSSREIAWGGRWRRTSSPDPNCKMSTNC